MASVWQFVGAMALSFYMSRLMWRATASQKAPLRLILTHGLSFVILAGFTGWLKAYGRTFNGDSAMIYVLPTILWFVYDTLRGRMKPQTI